MNCENLYVHNIANPTTTAFSYGKSAPFCSLSTLISFGFTGGSGFAQSLLLFAAGLGGAMGWRVRVSSCGRTGVLGVASVSSFASPLA
jgi:hypothetical protein